MAFVWFIARPFLCWLIQLVIHYNLFLDKTYKQSLSLRVTLYETVLYIDFFKIYKVSYEWKTLMVFSFGLNEIKSSLFSSGSRVKCLWHYLALVCYITTSIIFNLCESDNLSNLMPLCCWKLVRNWVWKMISFFQPFLFLKPWEGNRLWKIHTFVLWTLHIQFLPSSLIPCVKQEKCRPGTWGSW